MPQPVTLTFLLEMPSLTTTLMFFIKPTSVHLSLNVTSSEKPSWFLQSLFGFPSLNWVFFIILPDNIQELTCITTHHWALPLPTLHDYKGNTIETTNFELKLPFVLLKIEKESEGLYAHEENAYYAFYFLKSQKENNHGFQIHIT